MENSLQKVREPARLRTLSDLSSLGHLAKHLAGRPYSNRGAPRPRSHAYPSLGLPFKCLSASFNFMPFQGAFKRLSVRISATPVRNARGLVSRVFHTRQANAFGLAVAPHAAFG
ncbi:MAG TPA: hypothetical protein VGN31_22280 [Paraburkholderia sp.]|jgi:hypothetical protein